MSAQALTNVALGPTLKVGRTGKGRLPDGVSIWFKTFLMAFYHFLSTFYLTSSHFIVTFPWLNIPRMKTKVFS